MKFAIVNGLKSEATSRAKGFCQVCNSIVRGYAGPLKINHWKHLAKIDCDPWFENETEWHREWKDKFPKAWQETIIEKQNTKHIADVFNPVKQVVLEFQNSSISIESLQQREIFYDRMIWIVNIQPIIMNISFKKTAHPFSEKHVTVIMERYNSYRKMFLLGYITHLETIHLWKREGKKYIAERSLNKLLIKLNIYDYDVFQRVWNTLDAFETTDEIRPKIIKLVDKLIEFSDPKHRKLIEEYKHITSTIEHYCKILSEKDLFFLEWKRLHQRWNFAQKSVFFDDGTDYVYRILPKWEYGGGFIVKRYLKENFVKHYSKE